MKIPQLKLTKASHIDQHECDMLMLKYLEINLQGNSLANETNYSKFVSKNTITELCKNHNLYTVQPIFRGISYYVIIDPKQNKVFFYDENNDLWITVLSFLQTDDVNMLQPSILQGDFVLQMDSVTQTLYWHLYMTDAYVCNGYNLLTQPLIKRRQGIQSLLDISKTPFDVETYPFDVSCIPVYPFNPSTDSSIAQWLQADLKCDCRGISFVNVFSKPFKTQKFFFLPPEHRTLCVAASPRLEDNEINLYCNSTQIGKMAIDKKYHDHCKQGILELGFDHSSLLWFIINIRYDRQHPDNVHYAMQIQNNMMSQMTIDDIDRIIVNTFGEKNRN